MINAVLLWVMIARSHKRINCAMVSNLNDTCLAAAALMFITPDVSCLKEWHISKKNLLYQGNIQNAVRSWLLLILLQRKDFTAIATCQKNLTMETLTHWDWRQSATIRRHFAGKQLPQPALQEDVENMDSE